MDPYEVTNILLSKIKSTDPENASRIMGYILIQDLSQRDLQRLAFGPETLLQTVIIKAKNYLGLSSNTFSTLSAPSSPSPPLNPISRPNNISNPFSQASPRITGNGSFADYPKHPSPRPWPIPGVPQSNSTSISISPKASPFLSYDNIRAGSSLVPPFMKNGGDVGGDSSNNGGDLLDENQLDEYLSFLDDSTSKVEDFGDPGLQFGGFPVANGDNHLHRRRFSESDACFGAEDGPFVGGYKPCLYFARGFCKNGDNCKFVHGDFGGDNLVELNGPGAIVGSPREMEELFMHQHEEMMRIKAQQQQQQQQQQRLAYSKYMNFLLQQQSEQQRLGAAAAMAGDEFHRFGRFYPERNDLLPMGMAEKANSASRQIYLTFPADSSFKDEDVSNYFSAFGPVQDVRIPYQQKRMFGFVTFVLPETVKLILARGNPHFICDSRVLVKPYKEKGKVVNKAQQLLERGNFSPSSGPSGVDPRELYDFHIGTRMLYNTHEMILRRKLEEQAELQQAIELQGRRLINLQLPDIRGDFIPPRHQRSLSVGSPISLHITANQNVLLTSDGQNESPEDGNAGGSAAVVSANIDATEENLQHEVNAACFEKYDSINGKESLSDWDFGHLDYLSSAFSDFLLCFASHGNNVEHVNNILASPTKASGDQNLDLSASIEGKESVVFGVTTNVESINFPTASSSENNSSMPVASTCDMASWKLYLIKIEKHIQGRKVM
ncbi:hypothetical protein Tsubulata_029638 [Turnera subulata]|uniref:C3H1-type domain-containing protein n=1 Tax=Turnera subulata TaxID=218843 RepID=A0A9Q0JGD2_9ROSI|nr:hypothetical protein Tsubulata_029638 [Turnera subulata]